MANVTIKTPGKLSIKNETQKEIQFVPYKENFATRILPGHEIQLGYETVGQYFYYMKQKDLGLTIQPIDKFSKEDKEANVKVIAVPCEMTLVNTGTEVASFIPYRENFWVEVAAGEKYKFNAATAGQCIYYLNQGTETLVITDAAEEAEA